ncbi:hypothetical protein PTSG_09068 [Salpingoeca rosetta]|uniref:Uncharacterized protein n=1 Tax=Salpingoeca rosetta (strain ATCC 50818 / BSB-021) TaxID=946362 RepID=F2UM42_SALR5|nr:uncharacterized protein PTSG_09068 [Salpingoeca rosetta]EGD78191.1 hypothetical protein PTSG_09068 [Salpingoeca rosetta]|eukprot:XP_004989867.1 hypothetical protein PTSG_09068 [Salpingoeca rosetta]
MASPVALITGSARGIGREVARTLAARGWTVVASARTLEAARAVAEEEGGEGKSFVPLELDVERQGSVQDAAHHVQALGMKLDVLINNAAHFETGWTQPLFDKTMNVNFYGPVHTMRAFSPLLVDGGRIVNVASWFGQLHQISQPYRDAVTSCNSIEELISNIKFNAMDGDMRATAHSCYKLSKACLIRATGFAAQDPDLVQRNIKVFAVCPGWVRTQMGGPSATRSVPEGAASVLALVDPKEEHVSGGFYRDGKPMSID